MRKRAARDLLMQALRDHHMLFRWLGKSAEKIETEKRKAGVVKWKGLNIVETENVFDMSWWRQYADVLKLSCRREEEVLLLNVPVVDSGKNATNKAIVDEGIGNSHFETLNLSQNAYSP